MKKMNFISSFIIIQSSYLICFHVVLINSLLLELTNELAMIALAFYRQGALIQAFNSKT
jgi:hypothetical protein